MTLIIIASTIMLFWISQGLYTAGRIRNAGYHPLWWIGTGVVALGLVLPLVLLWL